MSPGKKAVLAASAGLLPALLAEFLALGLAGAGHGWGAPLLYGLGLFLAYPALFAVLVLGRRRRLLCFILLLAGLASDAALALETLATERVYFERVFAIGPLWTAFWILLWLGWQGAALVVLMTPSPIED